MSEQTRNRFYCVSDLDGWSYGCVLERHTEPKDYRTARVPRIALTRSFVLFRRNEKYWFEVSVHHDEITMRKLVTSGFTYV